MTTNLTEARVREAKPGPRTRFMWDSRTPGLGLRITCGGSKAYVLDYRSGGHRYRATLARWPSISLAQARKLAGEQRAKVRLGGAGPLEREREARQAPTVAEGVDRYLREYAPARVAIGRMAPKTLEEYGYGARRYILPALGRRKVTDVTRRHVETMVSSLPPTQRNRVLALASLLFNVFANKWEWRPQNTNPARGVERAREEPRDRVLQSTELAALSAALDGMGERFPSSVAAIRFACVTGLRIGEVLAVRWDDMDFESGRLTLPATKTGRRVHDLPVAALDILADVSRLGAWVFTTDGKAALTYRTVHVRFREAAAAAGLRDVRLHDLRRTVMTRAAALGVGTHVLRDLLGHRTAAMADRYVRRVGSPVREARELVGAEIAEAMVGRGGAVVPFRRHGNGGR